MSKNKIQFVCQACGYRSPKWLGRCPECSNWDTLIAESPPDAGKAVISDGPPPVSFPEIPADEEARTPTGLAEVDRVLGGGIVSGSVILVGGDPGIGKSTLLLQVLHLLARNRYRCLYVSGEESASQVRLRGERLGVASPSLYLYPETSLEAIHGRLAEFSPHVAVIDSIQSVQSRTLESPPGTFSQLRAVADSLVSSAKSRGFALFLIGHVTKEGNIAGPKLIEHLVDTVLYLEGDSSSPYRILRAVKNRFGSTNEIGVFEMQQSGLTEVQNPSAAFLSERPLGAPGSAVVCSVEGTRPVLVEIQGLVSPTPFGIPRRNVIGIDPNRLNLIVAVLDKRGGLSLSGQDIFANATGGIRISEPASDLGLAAALASSLSGNPIDPDTVFFGEIGLAGEVRGVTQPEIRIQEIARLGFRQCVLPSSNAKRLQSYPGGIRAEGVKSVSELLQFISDPAVEK